MGKARLAAGQLSTTPSSPGFKTNVCVFVCWCAFFFMSALPVGRGAGEGKLRAVYTIKIN